MAFGYLQLADEMYKADCNGRDDAGNSQVSGSSVVRLSHQIVLTWLHGPSSMLAETGSQEFLLLMLTLLVARHAYEDLALRRVLFWLRVKLSVEQ